MPVRIFTYSLPGLIHWWAENPWVLPPVWVKTCLEQPIALLVLSRSVGSRSRIVWPAHSIALSMACSIPFGDEPTNCLRTENQRPTIGRLRKEESTPTHCSKEPISPRALVVVTWNTSMTLTTAAGQV